MPDFSSSQIFENDAENVSSPPAGLTGSAAPSSLAPTIRALLGSSKRSWVRNNFIYTSTGTAALFLLTFISGPVTYTKGERISFWAHVDCAANPQININTLGAKTILNSRGGALSAGAIKANDPITIVFDGTSFRLISQSTNDVTLTGTTTFGGPAVFGGAFRINTNETTLSIQRNNANAVDVEAFLTANSATKHSIDLNRYGGPVTINGQTAWHAGNDGAGSLLDADLLDGQQGAFYQNASNINAGTLADARLPSTMSSKTISGTLYAQNLAVSSAYGLRNTYGNYGTVWYQDAVDGYYLITNSGDQNGAFNNLRPIRINLGSGDVAFGHSIQVNQNATISGSAYVTGELGVGNARVYNDGNVKFAGSMATAMGATYLSDALAARVKNDGSTANISITGNANGMAGAVRGNTNGTAMYFNWSGQGGQPSWLWGGNDGAQMYVYNPSNFSVNYANSAGYSNNTNFALIGNMTIGAVGTYCTLSMISGAASNPGDTRAGSALRWAAASGTNNSGSPDGTWRCAGQTYGSGNGTGSTTNWLRIS